MHPAPLLDGGGLVQSRVLDCVPSPHVTLHDDHGVQFVHPPSTETKKKIRLICCSSQCHYLGYGADVMVSTLDSVSRGVKSSRGRTLYVVSVGKTLYSLSASLHPVV